VPVVIDLQKQKRKNIFPLGKQFSGKSGNGEKIDFTNYFMRRNGNIFFGISGEFQFSRCDESYWKDEMLKMKQCGVNIVATYVMWNHHEEKEGQFCFEGRRNLRKFIETCREAGLYAIIRIGPFVHGEVRNGGLPDWLYSKPFEARELNRGFMACTKRYYRQIAAQLKGLLYKDGGPVIAAQLDNEYGYHGSPWEMTAATSREWIVSGAGDDGYMHALKFMAIEVGIEVPFYTCTAWGGVVTPEDMLPLWGGYAYQPWLFYSRGGQHPASSEYIYSQYHDNEVKTCAEFVPSYRPTERPYACCEMAGGMMCSYNYRFQLQYKSVDAMANIKLASGCNFLGYYVFRGGTNPKGNSPEFLNEGQVAKMTYDYQAAIGEFGQLRESYKRLKALHYFVAGFAEPLCETFTVLPPGALDILPEDTRTLRCSVRVKGDFGFLFLNNYQDHVEMHEKRDETVVLNLSHETITMTGISLAAGENCILPFNMDMSGITLKYAFAQAVTVWEEEGVPHYLFMVPEGMEEKFVFQPETLCEVSSHRFGKRYLVSKKEKKICIYTVPRCVMNDLYLLEAKGRRVLLVTSAAVLEDQGRLRLETDSVRTAAAIYPCGVNPGFRNLTVIGSEDGIWDNCLLTAVEKRAEVSYEQTDRTRYEICIPDDVMEGVKDAILQIEYCGDVGRAFIDGDMIHDNFYNGTVWEIGLRAYAERLQNASLVINITPLSKKTQVIMETEDRKTAKMQDGVLTGIKIKPIYEV